MSTVVLGVGNILLCDEGVGVHAARALAQGPLPPDVVPLEVGTAFLEALPEIERASRIIVVDAMVAGGAPGTVYRSSLEDCARSGSLASLHGLDLSRVLFLAGRRDAPEVVVIGVEPARIDWGTELSPEVQEMLPAVVDAVKSAALQGA